MDFRNNCIYRFIHNIGQEHKSREKGFINHQRQSILLYYAIAMIVATTSNLIGFSGSFCLFYTVSNSIMLTSFILFTILYTIRRLDIVRFAACMTISTHLFISMDCIYAALTPTLPHYTMVILVNMLILLGNSIIILATYLTRTAQWTTLLSTATYVACTVITGSQALLDYLFMIMIIFCFTSYIGFRITKTVERLQMENQTLRRDEEELMRILRLDKEQIKAYINLAKQQHSTEETSTLLSILGKTTQMTLIKNVTAYIKANESDEALIEKRFPDFTPSEIQICQLILRDKKLSEICSILGKTESNISTQRANIRKKLGLQPADNLRKVLVEMMKI